MPRYSKPRKHWAVCYTWKMKYLVTTPAATQNDMVDMQLVTNKTSRLFTHHSLDSPKSISLSETFPEYRSIVARMKGRIWRKS